MVRAVQKISIRGRVINDVKSKAIASMRHRAMLERLAIALWRYLDDGLIPEGAKLKPKLHIVAYGTERCIHEN